MGTSASLAAALGVQPSAISNWKARGRVPPEQVLRIVDATGGRVRPEELRPDLYRAQSYK
ncbi:transcriptional regulator [Sediminicurvatus halobius]|uniref:transcriptional regulator n=1 Tax=Sediminicurvatus halobius TaxID=2182432 RepID=UPI0035709F19